MPSLPIFTSLLDTCSSTLTSLTLLGWGPQIDNKSKAPSSTVSLPSLTHASFGFLDAPYAEQVLSALSFPNLTSFHLEDLSPILCPEDRAECSSLVRFIVERGTGDHLLFPLISLASLALHGIICSTSELQEFLSLLPALLNLSMVSVGDSVFRSLLPGAAKKEADASEPKRDTFPCPALERISCRTIDIISLAGIVGLRKSMKPSLPLNTLSFSVRETEGWEAVQPVRTALENFGVSLDLCPMSRR